jgi:inner membrane protein YidH
VSHEGGTPDAAGGTSSASRARDHMANERTYLAWMRTAANVMVVGLVLAKFADRGKVTAASLCAGGILVAVGAAGVVYGTIRYRQVNDELEAGYYVTGSRGRGPTVASIVLVVAILAALVVLVADGG